MLAVVATKTRLILTIFHSCSRTCGNIERVVVHNLPNSKRFVVFENLQLCAIFCAPPIHIYILLKLLQTVVDERFWVFAKHILDCEIIAVVVAHRLYVIDTEALCLSAFGAMVPRNIPSVDIENFKSRRCTIVVYRLITVVSCSPMVSRC